MNSINNMLHLFKISNKHVLCKLSITQLHFSIAKSPQRQKKMVFEIIEVG
jgi:hypothetical protein